MLEQSTLVLECTTDGLQDSVPNLSGRMDEVEVLATCEYYYHRA